MKDYHINIFYSESDEAYIADIPDLKYCSAHGETPEEALREVLIAKAAWLNVAQEEGIPIPEPKFRPAVKIGLLNDEAR
ncbi:MAG: type II toxin-antitoxin system HicB family antitoxin [Chitinophagaceae bacterium]|nr:type II toxin-antitoxin system HicB family antitoxin [Anaerolineae bacterium]